MRRLTAFSCLLLTICVGSAVVHAGSPRALPDGQQPQDARLGELRTLNGYFPFQPVANAEAWPARQAEIRRRILVSQGLWPLPSKAPLNPVIHGRVDRDDYVVDRVFFESIPGHFVTGSLYRPKDKPGPFPAILSPHGHWPDGRFFDHGEKKLRQQISIGAERFDPGGRSPLQARAVQLARMGCVVFLYDMTGYADSIQIKHRPDDWSHLDRPQDWGFMSVQAELRLQNMMGLQTWNSIRALDFLLSLDDVDSTRVGVTGASGGGTQSMVIAAIDDRITAAMPCVMVSTAMQGGCTCENAPLLRIGQGNIDIAAAVAPRPLGLTAADDWTGELRTKGFPDLENLYRMLGHPDRLTAVFHTEFKHNYNQVNRTVMYGFFNRHFGLGFEEPVLERNYVPLSREEETVWTEEHPAPSGDQIGDAHEVALLRLATEDAEQQINELIPHTKDQLAEYREIVGGAWETILGRRLDDVGNVEFHETLQEDRGDHLLQTGIVVHFEAGEQLPALLLSPKEDWNGQVVLWLTDDGKSGLFDGDELIAPVRKLLAAGSAILSADLFGQGEFNLDGTPPAHQPMWIQRGGTVGWHRFAGYTFGYNHPLFVRRAHDVLTLLELARRHEKKPTAIALVGLGESTGPVVAAALTQTGDAVSQTFVEIGDFDFEKLTRFDDPMFVPGAVRYRGIDGLLSLVPDHEVTVSTDRSLPISREVAAITNDPTNRGKPGPFQVSASDQLRERIVQQLTKARPTN